MDRMIHVKRERAYCIKCQKYSKTKRHFSVGNIVFAALAKQVAKNVSARLPNEVTYVEICVRKPIRSGLDTHR